MITYKYQYLGVVKLQMFSAETHFYDLITRHYASTIHNLRSPSYPVSYINVHHTEVLSFDWSRNGSCRELATTDRDGDVKFFDAETETSGEAYKPKQTLKTSVPVWKAR